MCEVVSLIFSLSYSQVGETGIVVEDRVYDCTHFLDLHPGGPEVFHQVRRCSSLCGDSLCSRTDTLVNSLQASNAPGSSGSGTRGNISSRGSPRS